VGLACRGSSGSKDVVIYISTIRVCLQRGRHHTQWEPPPQPPGQGDRSTVEDAAQTGMPGQHRSQARRGWCGGRVTRLNSSAGENLTGAGQLHHHTGRWEPGEADRSRQAAGTRRTVYRLFVRKGGGRGSGVDAAAGRGAWQKTAQSSRRERWVPIHRIGN
jgi:hypothetical protein